MSARSLRYVPAPDRHADLRKKIVALAHRHRRYGSGLIDLKLRQAGKIVNGTRVERLYREVRPQSKRRRRKQVAVTGRQPLERPTAANDVGSMDVVFGRVANGRLLKIPGIVDDGTHESVAVHPEHAIGGDHLVRILERICVSCGYAHIIGSDNAKASTGKPNQTAYVESFNGRFRDECLNEQGFLDLARACSSINTGRRGYNEEGPKKGLGGLTPSQHAKTLATRSVPVTAGL